MESAVNQLRQINSSCEENVTRLNGSVQRLEKVIVQTDEIHTRIAGPSGISDKVNSISEHTRHLDELPKMAQAMKWQAGVSVFLAALVGLFVITILIRGSNVRINIPGWLEISGHEVKQD